MLKVPLRRALVLYKIVSVPTSIRITSDDVIFEEDAPMEVFKDHSLSRLPTTRTTLVLF